MAYEAILFDNDGVLVDTEHFYLQATAEVVASLGFELDEASFVAGSLISGTGAWKQFPIPTEDLPAHRARRDRRYAELLSENELVISGVVETLRQLREHYRLAIVTSSLRQHFELIHRDTGLPELVDCLILREDVIRSKPDPEPYALAAQQLGLKAAACLVVEDAERGLVAANRAGMDAVAIRARWSDQQDLSSARAIFDRVSELPTWLSSL
jgi:HAD superfamily hydrolase (TIGR01509 family)